MVESPNLIKKLVPLIDRGRKRLFLLDFLLFLVDSMLEGPFRIKSEAFLRVVNSAKDMSMACLLLGIHHSMIVAEEAKQRHCKENDAKPIVLRGHSVVHSDALLSNKESRM